jgi:hypothetical protein
MIFSWQVISFSLFLLFSLSVRAQVPSGVQIANIQAIGTGCPQGSFSANISPDGKAFTLLLDNYMAESTFQNTISRLMCEVRVSIQVPRGWSYSVISADYRGYAYAELGTVVTHQGLYSFDGSRPRNERPGYGDGGTYSFRAQEFRGPYNSNYYIRHTLDPRTAPWSPCRSEDLQTLHITTFLMARNLNTSSQLQSQITLDSIDGSLQAQNYQLQWRQCRPTGSDPNPNPPGDRQPRPGPGDGRPPRFPR